MKVYRHPLRKPHLVRDGVWLCITRDGLLLGMGVTPKEAYDAVHL